MEQPAYQIPAPYLFLVQIITMEVSFLLLFILPASKQSKLNIRKMVSVLAVKYKRIFFFVAFSSSVLLNLTFLLRCRNERPKTDWLTETRIFESAGLNIVNELSVSSELWPRPVSIFLLETSGATILDEKQCCALESASSNNDTLKHPKETKKSNY